MGYYIRHLFEWAYWSMTPILYSFRRCPYAIRTRMSLRYASITVELREVFLANKPEAMLMLSAKGTVPVLQLDSQVLDESLDIMYWALRQADREQWLRPELEAETLALITENDGSFKTHLDHYKYWDRYPTQTQEHYRQQAERFLSKLEGLLANRPFLLTESATLADIAIFPFIRQFAFVDKGWFDQSSYTGLQQWLDYFLNSPIFVGSMERYSPWQSGDTAKFFPA